MLRKKLISQSATTDQHPKTENLVPEWWKSEFSKDQGPKQSSLSANFSKKRPKGRLSKVPWSSSSYRAYWFLLHSPSRTISAKRCIMWYSRLSRMWIRNFQCTPYTWGDGSSLVSRRSFRSARHKRFFVPSQVKHPYFSSNILTQLPSRWTL